MLGQNFNYRFVGFVVYGGGVDPHLEQLIGNYQFVSLAFGTTLTV